MELRALILSGDIAPGTRMVELRFAKRFGVSRTPIREALQRLLQDGLLHLEPGGGLVARAASTNEVRDIYLVREVLEGLAGRLAAERVTADDLRRLHELHAVMLASVSALDRSEILVRANIAFHDLIYGIAGNPTLSRYSAGLRDFVLRWSREAFENDVRLSAVLQDHAALIEALERRDTEAAERVSAAHVRHARTHWEDHELQRVLGSR